MNIFNRVALQALKKARTRTIVTIIGVILSVAMITAVTTFIASLQNNLIQGTIAKSGDWQVKFRDVNSNFLQKAASEEEVKTVAVMQNVGYTPLPGGTNPSKPYLYVTGLDDAAFRTIPLKLKAGRLPQNSGEIIVPAHIEATGGAQLHVGDSVTWALGGRTIEGKKVWQNTPFQNGERENSAKETFAEETVKTFTIVGIFKRPSFEEYAAPGYTAITKMDLERGEGKNSLDVYVTLKKPGKIYEYAKRIGANTTHEFNQDLLLFYGVSTNDSFNAVLYSLGGILIIMIMIGSILLIYNSFAISVSERARQFGILSSVGATQKQLQKSVLFEGVCIGMIGIPLGLLAGVGGIGITLHFVGNLFAGIAANASTAVRLTLVTSVPALVVAAVVSALVIFISATIPAKKATKKATIEIIRQSDDIKITGRAVKTSKVIGVLFGLPGTLALKNFKRNKKRYRSTVISLFVSIVLFISASAFGMYLKQGTNMTVQDFGYDISFSATQGRWHFPDEQLLPLYNQLKTADGVYRSAYRTNIGCAVTLQKSDFSERFLAYYDAAAGAPGNSRTYDFSIYFVDDQSYQSYLKALKLSPKDYGLAQGRLPAVAKVAGYDSKKQRTISFDVFNERTITLDAITGTNPKEWKATPQKTTLTIFETVPEGFPSSQPETLSVFAPYSEMALLGAPQKAFNGISMTFSSRNPMKSAAEMEAMIKTAEIFSGYSLFNAAKAQEGNRNLLLTINVFTYGFVILISLIAVANVFNTVSTNIRLRRREFAMLRSVGMDNHNFNRMMHFECLFYGLKALLYGLPVATAITFAIYKATLNGVDVSFCLPWSSIAIAIVSVFFVVFSTMLYSVSKIKKANVIDALREDVV